jgi:hypothetical protein
MVVAMATTAARLQIFTLAGSAPVTLGEWWGRDGLIL